MTPRGLRIRLQVEWAFALLARLWEKDSKTDAFRVLKTCEAIEDIPTVAAIAAGAIVTFWPGRPLWAIPLATITARLIGLVLTQEGVFIVLDLLRLRFAGLIFSYIPLAPSLVVHVPLIALIWWRLGWATVVVWVGGFVGAFVLYWILDFQLVNWRSRQGGVPITSSEVNFFNAYRLHADRLGVTRDVSVSEVELASRAWQDCLMDYAAKYPESVARFTA